MTEFEAWVGTIVIGGLYVVSIIGFLASLYLLCPPFRNWFEQFASNED